ncbi:MAG: signal peptide peptidase SppA [Candidatus Amulumruptor caecigallinarius]|nr:signal peptide peptidase SppA [Candidatus Amulumruptor caecigallinarius]MCM1397696.1 signal peptide peptidase SppA [Candidatus Amulumruptor caecigallinarius]MCM1454712.1 signal peptide peptidase SppA [bacterium]
MRKFFISFLGSMAALWVTIIIATLGLIVLIGAVSAASMSGNSSSLEVKKHSVLHLSTATDIVEHDPGTPGFAELISSDYKAPVTLSKVVKAIEMAADDDNIEGLFIEAGPGATGAAQCNAIITAINRFKESGKWVMAYGDTFNQSDYYIASAADSIFLNPIGMVDIHGLSATTLYYKGLLDKLGVKMNVVRVGTYKSAVEPFIREDMSEASREQTEAFLGSMWSAMTKTIADARHVTTAQVNAWADSISAFRDVDYLRTSRVIDRALYRHDMDSVLVKASGLNPSKDKEKEPRLISVAEYAMSNAAKQMPTPGAKHIAVLYAEGDIVDTGNKGISSEKLVPQIQELMQDDDVAGLILRVNSPGGSAFASEQIWEALSQFKSVTGKPFYVSMSNYAASGGYYISCCADRIYAEPLTITGSIGIFGMFPDASTLVNDKLGVHSATVSTNPEGELPSMIEPMTPRQQAALQNYVNRGYALFTKRVADGRKLPLDSVLKIAEGRVWDGATARRIGLVDKLGGLDQAIAEMAEKLEMKPDEIRAYPEVKNRWFYDILAMSGSMEERIMRHKLGAAYPLWQQVELMQRQSVLQARMEMGEPK